MNVNRSRKNSLSFSDYNDTKEDELSVSKALDEMKDIEMENLLDEIDCGQKDYNNHNDDDDAEFGADCDENDGLTLTANPDSDVGTDYDEDLDLFDANYAGFGLNDEKLEKEEIFIENILDEIENTEYLSEHHKQCQNENCKECIDRLWQYSMLVKDDVNNKNAIKLRYHKQKTFENFLKFEKIIADHSIQNEYKQDDFSNNNDNNRFINNSSFFYCPPKMDYLLHGYVRDIIIKNGKKCIVPSVVLKLLHCYYNYPNNKYYKEMEKYGIFMESHKCIVQIQECNLWRWEFDEKQNKYRWRQCNGLNKKGQTSLLYDEIKGFTRFVHFDKARNIMRGLQIIEANQKINHIHHNYIDQDDENNGKSVLEFGGFDFMFLFDENHQINHHQSQQNYGKVQQFKLEMIGPNHEYFAKQFMKCYNNIIESEIKNEIKMLKKIDLFPEKKKKQQKQQKEEETNNDNNNPSLKNLKEYVEGLQSRDDIGKHIKYARLIRKLLSNEHQPPIQEIIDCGIIQRLIYLMQQSKSSIVKFECAWSLTNIASGTQEHTKTLIKFDGITSLINVFKRKDSIVEIKEQCLWALGNIAGDSIQCRDQVLHHDILRYLLPLIRPYRMLMFKSSENDTTSNDEDDDLKLEETKSNDDLTATTETTTTTTNHIEATPTTKDLLMCQRQKTFMRNLVWTLSNLNRNKPLPKSNYIILSLHAINIILKDPLSHLDTELMQDASWTLSYLSDYNFDDQDLTKIDIPSVLLESKIIDILIRIILDERYAVSVKHPALRTIGNIATGNDQLTHKLLNKPGMMDAIGKLIQCNVIAIKRETLWLVSNITAGLEQQIEMVLRNSVIMSEIIKILNSTGNKIYDDSIRKEAIWAICNASSGGTDKQIRCIVNFGGLSALSRSLRYCVNTHYHGKVLMVLIEGIQNILRVGLNNALLNANANNPLNAILGQNAQNLYAQYFDTFGGLIEFERLLKEKDVSDDIKDRIRGIFDSFFPFRQYESN